MLIKPSQIIDIQTLTKNYNPLPESWSKAAGLMRNKKKLLETHVKKMRQEWNR